MSARRRYRRHSPMPPGLTDVLALYRKDPERFRGRFSQALVLHDPDCRYPKDRSPCTCQHGPDVQVITPTRDAEP